MSTELEFSRVIRPKDKTKIKRVIKREVVFHTDGNVSVDIAPKTKKDKKQKNLNPDKKGMSITADKNVDVEKRAPPPKKSSKDSETLNKIKPKGKKDVKNSKKNK